MRYLIPCGAMPTTAASPTIATGTSIKTLTQCEPTVPLWISEWGISFDGSTVATPGKVELIETDVPATVTAFVAADITKLGLVADGVTPADFMTLGTGASGYNASAEGSITAVRNLDAPMLLPPTAPFVKQFPLGERPLLQVSKFTRIRVTFGAGVNAYAYFVVTNTP